MRKHPTIAALGATALLAVPAPATAVEPSAGLRSAYDRLHDRVDRLGGRPGRDIVEDGVGPRHREAERRDLIRSMRVLRRMQAGLRAPAAPTATAPTGEGGAPAAGAGLQAIAACESGGDPSAVSPDGRYRGKYQFDVGTWQSVGGSGDPAAASEAEQDRRASALMAQRGASPWPVCGG